MAEAILYTPSDSDLREQELETKVQQVKRKLSAVQYDLKWTKDYLKRKEDGHSNQKNNNVEMLKKFLEEKDRLHTKVVNLANKVKEQGKQLKHMVDETSVELEGSGKGKRSYREFSYSKKEELQKSPKQPRVLE